MKLFLCGDVMTGRGIDQILAHPCNPVIHEPYARSALEYVELGEAVNGPIPRAVAPDYIWGDALPVLEHAKVDARIINLETAVTRNEAWLPKGINYRMHPANVACLALARLDCCVLANNHVLDWGAQGLIETLDCLHAAGLRTAGAGLDRESAEAPAIVPLRK
ncbi:MAG: CapA family protein, partial [Burkholderiales bacterium]